MNHKLIKFISILLLLAGFTAQVYAEGVTKGGKRSLRKTNGSPSSTKFNVNQISTWFVDDGSSDLNNLGNSGFVYPKGSNKTAFFQSGFVWGGKVNGNIRVGGSTYQSGILPGAVVNGTPEDPSAPNVHIYRVRRDYKTGSMSAEVRDGDGNEAEVRAQYENDWNTWPAELGAPYEDVNGDGKYDPTIDIPGVPGADQTIWFVDNDFDQSTVQSLYGSLPMGLECQTTIWGYAMAGPLGNMLFRKYKIINKGQNTISDMYVSMWSDPDLGDATDDYAGCDTTLSLGYIYNATNSDGVYGGNPPAGGFDFFQGPIVSGSANDSAVFNGHRVYGKKNLPMTAFYYFINSDPVYRDPTLGNDYQNGTLRFYRLLQGKMSTIDDYFPIPADLGGGKTTFPLSGDPVAGTGYLDGKLFPKGDRRIGMSSGPFTMNVADTQEIVVAQIVAGGPGTGLSNVKAVEMLKNYDKVAQQAYNDFFVLPSPPRAPMVNVTELDKGVILDWGSNAEQVAETESHDKKGFTFQGYNVYQLPQVNSSIRDAVRIATYDIVDEVKYILGDVVDPATGVTLKAVQQFGSDSGIKRTIMIDRDFLTNLPLVNGKKYFYAVTSYAYSPDPLAVPNNLENPLAVMTVVPHAADPGVRFHSAYGDTIKAVRLSGRSQGNVEAYVVDPKSVTGDEYQVNFTYSADAKGFVWKVTDLTKNEVKITDQLNQTGDEAYLTVDGLLIKVFGVPLLMKSNDPLDDPATPENTWGWNVLKGGRRFTWSGANGYSLEGFRGAMCAGTLWGTTVTALKDLKLVLAATDTLGNPKDPNDPAVSYAYRYLRGANAPAAKPEFAPFIVKPNAGYAYQDFNKTLPIAAYDIQDPANPKRLAVGFLENNVDKGLVDGKYWPPITGTDNWNTTAPREWLFVFDVPYTEAPVPELMVNTLSNGKMPVLLSSLADRNTKAFPGGDELGIYMNQVNTDQDAWKFTSATAMTKDDATAKADVEKINVFPNPYYGTNSQELNKYQRFVTFSHLPLTATIRIFNLAGQLVKTIKKDSPDQFQRWDLATDSGLPVASGLYIVYVDMPQLGKTKILKVAVIQEQQILDRF